WSTNSNGEVVCLLKLTLDIQVKLVVHVVMLQKKIGLLKQTLSVSVVVLARMQILMLLATFWRWDTSFCLWRVDAVKVALRSRKQVKSVRKSPKSFCF